MTGSLRPLQQALDVELNGVVAEGRLARKIVFDLNDCEDGKIN